MFEDALKTWTGAVVRVHLTTGKNDAGRLYLSNDGQAIALTGELFRSQVDGRESLVKMEHTRIYRTEAIIGIEHLMEDPT